MLILHREADMHPEADALLSAIWDHPEDDTPRLVYADWLQEHGYERYAEFIRVSVAIARQVLPQTERARLRRQRYELGRVIAKSIPFTFDVVNSVHPRDGIPESQYGTDAASFLTYCGKWWPLIAPRSLSLCDLVGREREVASCDYLRRLVALSCSGTSGWGFYEQREEINWQPIGGILLTALGMRTDLDRLSALTIEPIAASTVDLLGFADTRLAGQLEELRLWVQFPDGTREDLRGENGFVSEQIRDFVALHADRFANRSV